MNYIERRLRIAVPEATGVYGRHMPLSLQLLLSLRVLQTLRGYVVALSVMLSVQVVAQLPSLVASVGTKLGSKRIFAAAGVNAFPTIKDLSNSSMQIWCVSDVIFGGEAV
ncbi:uncharacterized protein MONOS_4554 [Monocercomonoides exilis]|uniref:uncharacterized protein n=1 Tax=Monocercomonoides exilis TaxID=2049356 RepID=UPI00355A72CF|nr:hypothetical protein MONOS_4554 [Monocercomonoides exilis]|eukprot:MONOS_4554.1-p1 / transcript=MONOS_4554.1 / gene=MONOS_4554 / organism=Monocercomonoides_exilis_PA203 / gene_product=unspecified product / transcript_product=unspecified product / location=Mono_scaffold00122:59844-60173(+) / protein_length=110 / sequence_SO=supercontig / SO=protein_coding / is_pseudo=false